MISYRCRLLGFGYCQILRRYSHALLQDHLLVVPRLSLYLLLRGSNNLLLHAIRLDLLSRWKKACHDLRVVSPLLDVCDGVLCLRVIESFILDIRHFGKGPIALMRLASRGVQALPKVFPEALIPLLLVYSGAATLLDQVRLDVLDVP